MVIDRYKIKKSFKIKTMANLKMTCKRCGDRFEISNDDQDLLDEGIVGLGEMIAKAHCNPCLGMRSPGEEDMYSDADVGL